MSADYWKSELIYSYLLNNDDTAMGKWMNFHLRKRLRGRQFVLMLLLDLEQYSATAQAFGTDGLEIIFMAESGYLAFCLRWS